MNASYPQILITKSTLPDITAWRNRSLPLLDGGTGEHSISPMPTFPLAPCADTEPRRIATSASTPHFTSTVKLPKPATQQVVTSTVMDPTTVPPVTVDHGTSPTGNRLPLKQCEHDIKGISPSINMLANIMSTEGAHLLRLQPPLMNSDDGVTGMSTPKHRIENKRRRITRQESQVDQLWWSIHTGSFCLPSLAGTNHRPPPPHKTMWPQRLATLHPAGDLLLSYASEGCPVITGAPWSLAHMQAAVDRGPHESAMVPEAKDQLHAEVLEKVAQGHARLIDWDNIRHAPPPETKISPVAMIPHKSRPFRAILDLSFSLRLGPTTRVPSVNENTMKTAPRGAIDQLGHALARIIHAFGTAEPADNIYMAKWDIKDGFWRLDCAAGQEWNFAYVLPSSVGGTLQLVIPTSLQMGWIESPPYFCAASETARDVGQQYIETPVGSLRPHKFLPCTQQHPDFDLLPLTCPPTTSFPYLMEVYVDDFISLAIPASKEHLDHAATAMMAGIHDVFPPHADPAEDPISLKKTTAGEAAWSLNKEILGLMFDGVNKTVWLSTKKRDLLIDTITGWLRQSSTSRQGIQFHEFRSTMSKIQHAFLTIPAGKGLLSPFYRVLAKQPPMVYLHRNAPLREAVVDCRTFLRESVATPTRCRNLITAWPDYVGIKDASRHGVGGIIIGENKTVPPTVFRFRWPDDISNNVISASNTSGTLTNSDLEMAGLLILWLVMEDVCPTLTDAHVALFSDNSPTVHWVQRLAAKHSTVAMQLVRALALRMQLKRSSPLTTLHIAGKRNAMTDIPSRSFGSVPRWHCKSETDFSHLFNMSFPLPNQAVSVPHGGVRR